MSRRIGDLIPSILHQATARQQALQQVQQRWAKAVGKTLAAHTRVIGLRKGRLYVHTDELGASFALSLEKPRLLKALQTATTEPIEEIVIRAGAV